MSEKEEKQARYIKQLTQAQIKLNQTNWRKWTVKRKNKTTRKPYRRKITKN